MCSVVALFAPKRHTVSIGTSPPSIFRPRACGCPYRMAILDGPVKLASSSYHFPSILRELRCTSVLAKLLAAKLIGDCCCG